VSDRRGFTLVELVTALVLFGIVSVALYHVLLNSQRGYREQTERLSVNMSARDAISILPAEIRELDARDGDILAMSTSSLIYKSMQGLYVQCDAPATASLAVVLDRASFFGLRAIDPTQDSILILAEGDSTTRGDDGWLHANVVAVAAGTACPAGRASLTVTLAGVSPSQLARVGRGAPVRTFRIAQVLLYRDAGGDWWLGGRQFQKSSGTWATTQPIVGPLSSSGLGLAYFDTVGAPTSIVTNVARVGIAVESRSPGPVRGPAGSASVYLLESLMTQVTLRNNALY
jgi:prepilin-type N-terminal cleavage/methylation domain-containing protein